MLKKFLEQVASDEVGKLKSMYGSNFQYALDRYTKEEAGLFQFGVHYSNNKGFAVFPQSHYYPKGVYFYVLSSTCTAGKGRGFATDREWANIGKINNERMMILKQGHPMDFTEAKFQQAVEKLKKTIGRLPEPTAKPGNVQPQEVPAVKLFNLLHAIEIAGKGLTNKVLHQLGYDGVIDYDHVLLPVESCQGVMTWPGALTFQEALPVPRSSKNVSTDKFARLSNILRGLSKKKNGSIKLSADEIAKAIEMLPKFYHLWDSSDAKYDFYGLLMQKLDFGSTDAWEKWVQWKDLGPKFYPELEQNPTTPKSFWQELLYSSDPAAKLTARDMLGL